MKKIIVLLSILLSLKVSSQNNIVLHIDDAKTIINRNIYGHFAEHLGRCIYDGFYVGDSNKIIPNKEGIRLDIIEALKKLKVPVLRWPGGCFADNYHWKDGIGAKANRPSLLNTSWGGVTENNAFGTHEFLNLCKWLNAEPYLAGNVGGGTVQEFTDWVKYVNQPQGNNPMPSLRVANGQAIPWDVKFWGVGNEAWGCGGNMTPEYYANVFKQFSTFMPQVNSSKLFRIASGSSSNDYHWTEVLMKEVPSSLMQGLALHHYSVINWDKKGPSVAFSEQEYFTIMKRALAMDEYVTKHSAIMDKYDSTKKVALVVDEWGGWYDAEKPFNDGILYQQNTMRDAMIAGVTLNIFNNHADRVKMANLAQIVNVLQAVILTQKEKLIVTPTYHVMEMYNVHQDATLIPVNITSNNYVFGNDTLKAVSASASKDKDGIVHISLTNIDAHQPQKITINVTGIKATNISGRILQSSKIQNYNSFEKPELIQPETFTNTVLQGNNLTISLPPFSVVVLSLK